MGGVHTFGVTIEREEIRKYLLNTACQIVVIEGAALEKRNFPFSRAAPFMFLQMMIN
jgi:hypothetical protein